MPDRVIILFITYLLDTNTRHNIPLGSQASFATLVPSVGQLKVRGLSVLCRVNLHAIRAGRIQSALSLLDMTQLEIRKSNVAQTYRHWRSLPGPAPPLVTSGTE